MHPFEPSNNGAVHPTLRSLAVTAPHLLLHYPLPPPPTFRKLQRTPTMDKKQGFFWAVARGLSPSRARSQLSDPPVARPGNLAPLMEGPDSGEDPIREKSWFFVPRAQVDCGSGHRRSELRMMMGVMGAPLAPVHVSYGEPLPHLSIKNTPFEISSAQYILQQYIAASGGLKPLNSIKNSYVMGKVKMVVSESKTVTKVVKNRHASKAGKSGGFVLWQMAPEMWYVELAVGGSNVRAGCNGKIIWRHTPWLGAHAAKGPVRPLRRALQGLDPLTTASMFANAQCIGEKNVNGEDCFILKICTDPETLNSRSEGPAEIIRHVLFGYFSQRSGLLIRMEDSHLTRFHSNTCGETIYWETTTNSFLEDYRPIDSVMIAHSGRSIVTLFRFGEAAMSHRKNIMEETWTIEEVAFNVHGLSLDCFIPPSDLKCGSVSETFELPKVIEGKSHGQSCSYIGL